MSGLSERKQLLFWILAAFIAVAVLVVVLTKEHLRVATSRATYIVGEPAKGAELFFGKKRCSVCHSVNGSGGRLAPDLGDKRPGIPAMGWMTTVLWNHAPGMWRQMRSGSTPTLDQQEMAHVLAFLFEAANADRTGDGKAGARIFNEKGCARCHSVRSAGGQQAPDLAKVAARGDTTAWICAMWNHAQSMVDPVERVVGQWPRFAGKEMNHLVTYAGIAPSRDGNLPRGNTERGWRVFQSKCIQCHTVRGQGGSVGPELGPQNDLPLRPADFAGVLWNHAPAMLRQSREKGIAVAPLEPSEVADLLRFLASLRYVEPAGTAFLGQRVFSQRGCARCHGEKGEGTAMGPRIRNRAQAFTASSLAAALWKHGPKMVLRAEELDMPWPTLAATDVGDLVSFFNDPARGR